MGNYINTVRTVLDTPMTQEELQTLPSTEWKQEIQTTLRVLLQGETPTNFIYEDICQSIQQFADEQFVTLPVWTFNLKDTNTAAMCMLNNWPEWSDAQIQDGEFLSTVRMMIPMFKEGSPIGHARFMYYDRYHPMSRDTLVDENKEWMQVLQDYLPVPALANKVVFEYQGLCPSRFQRRTHRYRATLTCFVCLHVSFE